MTDIYLHGIETIEKNAGPRPVQTIDTGVIALFGTAPNANEDIWPLDTVVPVHGYAGLPGALGSTGTLPDAFDGIFDQATRASQTVLAVRIEEGSTLAKTMQKLIGSSALKTGMHAIRNAETDLAIVPKLFIAPGFTSLRPTDGIQSIAVTEGGVDFTSAPEVVITGGGGTGAQAVATINTDGEVDQVTLVNHGVGYQAGVVKSAGRMRFTTQPVAESTVTIKGKTVTFKTSGATGLQVNLGANLGATLAALAVMLNASVDVDIAAVDYTVEGNDLVLVANVGGTAGNAIAYQTNVIGATPQASTLMEGGDAALSVSFTGGEGTGATATATLGVSANPVVSEMLSLARRYRGAVIADGPNTNAAAAVAYRLDFNDPNLLIVDPFAKVFKDAAPTNIPASARVAGMQAVIDYEEGFWVSPSNHVIQGIIGAARTVEHSVNDPSVESQYLNKNGVATIVRSKRGGFILFGNRAAAADPLNAFWSVRRSHNTIMDSIEIAAEPFLDKPFSVQHLVEIAETVNGGLRRWQGLGATLGGRVWLDPTLNTKETWVMGHLYVSYDAEAPAPIEHITFVFSRNTGYYETLADRAVREIARLSGRTV